MFTKKAKIALKVMCLTLAFCMLFGIMPMYASEAASDESDEPVQIVVVTKDIRKGAMIVDTYIELKTLEKGEKVPANAITSISEARGKYAVRELYAGEYLQKGQLSSQKVAAANTSVLKKPIAESEDAYVVVTDYITPNTDKDLAGAIQELIDKNPNRTIYFPDGVYIIAKPIIISGEATDSVSLELSDGAVIKAASTWKSTKITINGSNAVTSEATTNALITIEIGRAHV